MNKPQSMINEDSFMIHLAYQASSDRYLKEVYEFVAGIMQERDDYALLIFQPCGEAHHDANKCPYCRENLNK